ncbi:MAG TPA: hypothetical protein VHG72_09525 [Polyangia bacterium]|nr:hypothetical protein [Polyangia bacterium]
MSEVAQPDVPTTNAPPPRPKRSVWIIAAAVALIAGALWSRQRSGPSQDTPPTSITLVTSDRGDLACASQQTIGRYRCEFQAPGAAWPQPPAAADRLVPYYTVDHKLYVIPGLFEQPALDARYKAEEPQKLARDQRPRFTADCQLKVIDRLKDLQTRWLKAGDWTHEDEAPVAIASNCRIQ